MDPLAPPLPTPSLLPTRESTNRFDDIHNLGSGNGRDAAPLLSLDAFLTVAVHSNRSREDSACSIMVRPVFFPKVMKLMRNM